MIRKRLFFQASQGSRPWGARSQAAAFGKKATPLAALHCAGDFARTEAMGAHIDVLGRAIDNRLDPLDVGLPRTIGAAVGVGQLNAEHDALVAEFTLSHSLDLLADLFLGHSR